MSTDTPKEIEFVARAMVVQGNRILLCRNRKHGHCYLPGGHVEPGERAPEALTREFLEETGLRVIAGDFLLANENIFRQRGKPKHEFSVVFHVEHPGGPWPETVPSLEGKIAFEWVDIAALPESGLLPPAILAWLMAGGPDQPADHREAVWVSDRQSV